VPAAPAATPPPGSGLAPSASGSLRLRVGRVDRLYVVGSVHWLVPARHDAAAGARPPPPPPLAADGGAVAAAFAPTPAGVAPGAAATRAPADGDGDGDGDGDAAGSSDGDVRSSDSDARSSGSSGDRGAGGGGSPTERRRRRRRRRRYRAVVVDGGGAALERILVTPTLWTSHLPSAYEAALDSLGLGGYFDAVAAEGGRECGGVAPSEGGGVPAGGEVGSGAGRQ